VALPSTGLHTNGYSLARRIVPLLGGYDARPHQLNGQSIGEALLAPHRCYIAEYTTLQQANISVHAMAHLTGGGVIDNLPRVLPDGCGAIIRRGTWLIPPIFELLVDAGNIAEHDAYHAFNMGIGMLVIVPAHALSATLVALPEASHVGEVVAGSGVTFV
jgi:phosphoribosylformylglycinamidine cyclo-ligase